MSFVLTTRNTGSYSNPNRSTGNLLTEGGDNITTEDGSVLLIENPTLDPNLGARHLRGVWDDPSASWDDAAYAWDQGHYTNPSRNL